MSLAKEPSLPDTGSLSFFRRAERERVEPVPGLVAGKVVGDFRLVSLLGQGGMGQVWEAAQVSLGSRTVAVKFVRPERVTEHQLELFAREARAGGRLSHSGIVGVHGHGESDGLAWIAMELVTGAWTLRDFLDEVSRADEVPAGYDRHVARFAAEIADAVQAAHEAGVIHRDLKPQNILVTPDDHPKVTDFGLARLTDESALSQTGDFAGTYFYMSPEQVTAKRMGIDHRSDVFSLGIVLYEMLALRRPFEGDTSHQVAAQIVTKDPPDPRTLRSRIPRDLVVIAGKALEKDRDKRYQTMAELAADLRRWLSNQPIHATPPTRVDRAVKWMKRNPTKSVAAGLVSAALVVISLLLAANVRANKELAQTNDDLEAERMNLALANTSLEAKTTEALANAQRADREAMTALENWRVAKANEGRALEGERQAEEEKERADRETEAAKRKAAEVLRLSALQELDDLLAEAGRLWPAYPDLVPRYEAWIARALALVVDLPEHEAQRASLRARALPRTDEERRAERESHPEYGRFKELVASLGRQMEVVAAASSAEEARAAEEELARMEAERVKLDLRLDERRDWRFGEEDREARWWDNQLTKLIAGLRELEHGLLAEDGVSEAHGWSIPKRHAFASSIAERSVSGAETEARWAEALSSTADRAECPSYGGLVIEPQMGLVPIGRDPESGLWEFAHLQTGEIAERGADGRLVLTEETGLVFVLLPGGAFAMGAQRSDPNGPNYDAQAEGDEDPVHEVTLSPFFLSKYEMTQGQWQRFTGRNPSYWGAGRSSAKTRITALHPVEQVRWWVCDENTRRLDLRLPTEAQWEFGCRAGTGTTWQTGDEVASLAGFANIADEGSADAYSSAWLFEAGFRDGFDVHGPVGSLRPNALGIHDMHGNVWEWCMDGYESDFYRGGIEKDPVSDPAGSSSRVAHGGSFGTDAVSARSASRFYATPEFADANLGLRPARIIAGSFTTSPLVPVGR